MHDKDLIGPGIETEEAGKRHGCLLLEVLHIKFGALGRDGLHPEGRILIALGKTVTDHRFVEGLEVLDALLQLLEIEAEVLLPAFEFLRVQQFQGFLGCRGVVGIGVVHGDAIEDAGRREEQPIVEGVLGIETVSEDDVGNLEGQDRVEVAHLLCAILRHDAGGIEQALGDDDRVADGERLERLGQQRPAADRAGEGDVVVGQNIVREGFERLVELAGRIEKAGLEEAFDDVVLCLLDPGALGTEGADVLCVVADVGRADDFKRGVCSLRRRNLEDIAPDVVDRFELESENSFWSSSVPAKSPLKRTTLPLRASIQTRPKKRPKSFLPEIGVTSKTAVGVLPRKSLRT